MKNTKIKGTHLSLVLPGGATNTVQTRPVAGASRGAPSDQTASMTQRLLVYRFACAFREAIIKMLQRSVAAIVAGVVTGVVIGAGAARAQDVVWYKPMPAIIPAASTVFGLYPGIDFHLAKGTCRDCAAPRQALWYFRDDLIAVPSYGVNVAGFTPGIAAQEDVKRWYASATPEQHAARPPLLWIGATHLARHLTLTEDDTLKFPDRRSVPFKTVDKLKSNRSFYDDSSKAYFQQRPLRMRGALTGGAFVARTIWPQDWAIDEKAMKPAPLAASESLLDLVRKHAEGKNERFETRLLWEKTPAASLSGARDWSGRAVIGIVLNGAQGDNDEAHAGHFAVATGRFGKGGDWSEWLVNNFYDLDRHSEKGIVAAMLPMDNYLADLNSGQAWYRPSYMLVAVLKNDRAAHAYQGAMARVFNRFYRHDLVYRHARANSAGISMDTLRALGWNIPLTGAISNDSGAGVFGFRAADNKSFASGVQVDEYLREEQSRLFPALAFDAAGRDLLRIAGGGAPASGPDASALENLLREDLEALVFVRIPQLPSSRAFGLYPVASVDEYLKRAPADKSQWKIVPLEARPLPQELIPLDVYREPPAPSAEQPLLSTVALLAALAALLGGVMWLWGRLRRARLVP